MEARSSYLSAAIHRNEDRLERLRAETAAGEIASRALPPATPGGHARGAKSLRFQLGERSVDELRIDAASFQIGPDQQVTGRALREGCCACTCQAFVVDVADTDEGLERALPFVGSHPTFA